MTVTTHDIIVDGVTYIMEWHKPEAHEDEPSTIMITEGTTCDDFEAHELDESCDGCSVLETYDFMEYDQSKQFDAILAKNILARDLRDHPDERSVLNDLTQLETIEQYTGTLNQPSVRDIVEDETGAI